MHTIEIDDEVLAALKKKAEPFVDTPNMVLRRLLALPRNTLAEAATSIGALPRSSGNAKQQRRPRKGARAPAGTLLPEREYIEPLLQVLRKKGGRAPAQEVIEEVGGLLADRLTALDKERLASGGVRWQNRIQFVRLRLLDQGLLRKGSSRGIWELTEEANGRRNLEAGN